MVNISIFRLIVVALVLIGASNAQPLSPPSSRGCNNKTILANIKKVVKAAVAKENRMGASLLRLHFHDCFVNGCDGSVLLDDNANISFTGEKNAAPNANSLRGFDIIDNIKSLVESSCPSRISCADILAVAARDAVIELGGRGWNVAFRRNDSTTASLEEANNVLPGPGSNLGDLVSAFKAKGFNTSEMVALSGSHTIGFARCRFFRNRIYSNTNISAGLAAKRQAECPRTGGDDNLSPLDTLTPTKFNNDYYKNLMNMSGLFNSDQQLFNNGSTDALVRIYAAKPSRFFADFASAMAKMAVLPPLPGAKGQIRTNCHRVN